MATHRNIKILTWFNFFTDFQPYAPVLILYFAKITGSYASALGLYSLMALSAALAEVPTGVFSDRIGRRKTVILGAVCVTITFILYAVGSPWSLFLGSIFGGIADAFYSGNNDALLHDSLSENNETEHYAHHLGRLTGMFQLSLGLSAILGGLVANKSFIVLMWISVVPQIVCVVLATMLTEPRRVSENRDSKLFDDLRTAAGEFWKNEKLRLLSSASILEQAVGEASYRFQAAFFASLMPVWAIGIVRAAINGIAFLSFHFSGKVIKKLGALKTAFSSNIVSRVINLVAFGFPSLLSPVLIALDSVPFGTGSVAKNTLFQKEFRPDVRATMGSFNSLAGSVAFTIIAFLIGLTADHFSPAKAVFIFQLLLIPSALAYLAIHKRNRRESV